MVTLNQYLQQKMKDKGINITELAKLSCTAKTTTYNIIKYTYYSPQFRSVVPLLKALDITIEDLYRDKVIF